jgi:Asp-tRNA(Asn)/Glu-tRNA(Gln) amidotransferase A subunit family amidase
MARTVTDLAKLLDVMVGYDPEDPVTALGVGHVPESYTASLDPNGLRGARIGIIREPFGSRSQPESQDFKTVDEAFNKAVQELRQAGAELVDPVVIPDLNKLLAGRGGDASGNASLEVWLSRNPNSPFKNREDIRKSPDIGKVIPPPKAEGWTRESRPPNPAAFRDSTLARNQLEINVMKLMADNKLDAIVHKTVEHQPTLIKDGMNPPYVSGLGVPFINTFLVYAASMSVPAGFTSDGLPIGITFFGRAYSEPLLLKFAYAYEQATHHREPPKTTPALEVVQSEAQRQ